MAEKIDRSRSKLLVNVSAPESAALALAAGADGVHLAGKPAPGAARSVRQAFRSNGRDAIISVPCHSLDDIHVARKEQVDLMLFSPVFEKLPRLGAPEVSHAPGPRSTPPGLRGGARHTRLCPGRRDQRQCPDCLPQAPPESPAFDSSPETIGGGC
jgi:hypothetical protein